VTIVFLSAGVRLQHARCHARVDELRQRMMRHFLGRELDQTIAVPSLSGCVQTTATATALVAGAGPTKRISSLQRAAPIAEAVAAVAACAKTKLDTTTLAHGEPKLVRQQAAPRRRFLDMAPKLW
jgi:hypothetical protein